MDQGSIFGSWRSDFQRKAQMGALTYIHLFGLLATHFFLPGTEAGCPSSWLNYQAHCYGMVAIPRTWMEAEIECQNLGHQGHLASLLSEAEHAAVSNYIKNNFPTVETAWISLHDPRNTGNWVWSDSSPLFYQAWNAGEPNNKGKREYCVKVSKKEGSYGTLCLGFKKWSDVDCKLKMASLCKTRL